MRSKACLLYTSIPQLSGNHAPLSFPAMPGLVAAPAHIGAADIQNRIRLQFTQHRIVDVYKRQATEAT